MPRLAAPLALILLALPFGAAADPIRPLPVVSGEPHEVNVADLIVSDAPLAFFDAAHVAARYDGASGVLTLLADPGFEGLALVPFTVGGEERALPVRARRLIEHTFTFPAIDAEDVHVIGQFNDWSRTRDRLARQPGGEFSLTLALDPGRYEYKFTVDGEEVLDPRNEVRVPNPFGDYNNILTVAPRFEEGVDLHLVAFRDGELELAFERGGRPADVDAAAVIALLDDAPLAADAVRAAGDRVFVRPPAGASGRLRAAVTRGGQATRLVSVDLRDGAPLAGDAFTWRDAILYQIMVDRFLDGDPSNTRPVPHDSVASRANYHGGDLQGILQKMEEGYFERLGVNTLWLSPVVQNTERAHREYPPPHRFYTGYHGYWPTHPTRVDHRFGDMALLQELVAEARQRGIRVLLDFVANHVHEDHPFFREHREWFGTLELPDGSLNLRLWDEQRLTTWFEPYLPSFDFEGAPEAIAAMTENAVWWLDASGADGFRHDAVKHIPNEFWRALTRQIRQRVDPDRDLPTFQIGETFGSYDLIASYVNPGQLDAQFNFNLYDTALHAFLDEGATFAALDAEMHRTLDVYGVDHVMGNLMDSHDKARFLAFVDGDIPRDGTDDQEIGWQVDIRVDDPASYRRAELYLAYMLTVPGVPTIYYGNEIGKTGANDPDNRRPMRFGDALTPHEREHKERVRRLIQLRQELPALRRGGFRTLHADEHSWAYLRAGVNGRVVVALNKGEDDAELRLDLPAALAASGARDAVTEEVLGPAGAALSLSVPAGGYRIVLLD
jgi:cyclomaltodextrinase / maltogenic alpha-amylase / neopullulanase